MHFPRRAPQPHYPHLNEFLLRKLNLTRGFRAARLGYGATVTCQGHMARIGPMERPTRLIVQECPPQSLRRERFSFFIRSCHRLPRQHHEVVTEHTQPYRRRKTLKSALNGSGPAETPVLSRKSCPRCPPETIATCSARRRPSCAAAAESPACPPAPATPRISPHRDRSPCRPPAPPASRRKVLHVARSPLRSTGSPPSARAIGFVVGDELLRRLAEQHHVPELHRLLAAATLQQFRVRLEDADYRLRCRHLLAANLRPPGKNLSKVNINSPLQVR